MTPNNAIKRIGICRPLMDGLQVRVPGIREADLPTAGRRRGAGQEPALSLSQENYSGQRIYFVIVEEYVYLVPYVVEKDGIFLKTIIPSRKATRAYKKEREGS
jgi:hypothetical protein